MRQAPIASEAEIQAMHEKLHSRVEQRSARVVHNHEVAGSNPAPATPLEWEKPKGGDASEPDTGTRHVVAGAASAKNTPLEWEKPKTSDATGVKTRCGRYSCAKVTVNGKVSYELWKLAPGGGWFRQLNAGLDNFLQVQKLAQIDADKVTP
jgi:hypothetical protein